MAYRLTTDKTWAAVEADIRAELKRWGADTYSLTAGTPSPEGVKTVNPRPTSLHQTPEQATVTLVAHWPKWKNRPPLTLRYNKQDRAVDNARVIFLAVESMRLNEVRGIGDLLRETYAQLPPPAGATAKIKRDPYEVLGVTKATPLLVVKAAYSALAKAAHPDAGGSNEAMAELNEAFDVVSKAAPNA